MQTRKILLLFIVPVVVSVAVGIAIIERIPGLVPWSKSIAQQEQKFIGEMLPLLTEQLNETAPYMIDPSLRFDEAVADSAMLTITYFNTFVSLTSNDTDFAFVDEHLPGANNYLCNDPQIRKLMSYGINYVYVYRGRDGETVRRFTFSEKACQPSGQI